MKYSVFFALSLVLHAAVFTVALCFPPAASREKTSPVRLEVSKLETKSLECDPPVSPGNGVPERRVPSAPPSPLPRVCSGGMTVLPPVTADTNIEEKEFPPAQLPLEKQSPASSDKADVDAPARPASSIRPEYPPRSRLKGEEGTVVVEFDVMADGRASNARVVESSGYRRLDDEAVRTALAAMFIPAKKKGKSVFSRIRLPVKFKLR